MPKHRAGNVPEADLRLRRMEKEYQRAVDDLGGTVPGVVYHYTKGVHARGIVEARALKPATAGVPKGERAAVWFSSADPWEPTVGSLDMIHDVAGGAFRIAMVGPVPLLLTWKGFVRSSGVTSDTLEGLIAAADACGADPLDWFVSFDPVPLYQCDRVEQWSGDAWKVLVELDEEVPDAEVDEVSDV